jgi:hypothetical protein
MPTASNLYVEKIFAEQPNSIWAFDEPVDYISLITESNRNISTWTRSGGTNTVTQYTGTDSPLSSYSSQVAVTTGTTFTMTGAQFTSNYDSFAIGFYLKQYSGTFISKIEIGYSINGGTAVYDTSYPAITTLSTWIFYSSTFKVTSGTTLIAPIIRITYSGSITFITNGLTIGCQSEEFNSSSLGQTKISTISSLIPQYPGSLPSTQYGIEAVNYGLQKTSGYYLIDSQTSGDKLVAKNSTIPMTYGASNSTIIYPHPQSSPNFYPSIIIPGGGFLTEVNEHTDMTFECWFKINSLHISNTTPPRRIFGPVSTGNTDGLYVNGQFLVFKVGNLYDSYFVSEWFRPMLIQISITFGGILVFINGTQVMQISYTSDNPAMFLSTYSNGKDNQWLGFYAYSDIPNIEVDGVAIYPYASSEIISNRRYIYGQGVSYPTNIDTAYSGETIIPDYSFSGYANGYNYPQIGKWKSGRQDNLNSQPSYIALNNYLLPRLNSSFGNTYSVYDAWLKDLYIENASITDNYINLKPTSNTNLNKLVSGSWSSAISFLSLDSISFLNSTTAAIYGVFKSPSTSPSVEQTLIKLYNYSTGDYFKISFGTDRKVYYKYKIGSSSEVTLTASTSSAISVSTNFSAGINLTIILSKYPELNSLLGNINQLSVSFGGESLTTDYTFTGLIYQLSLLTDLNYKKVVGSFDTTNGNVKYDETSLKTHYPSYGVIAYKFIDDIKLDVKMNAYWEDNIPLSTLCTYVTDASGNKVYSLNSIQYNLGYPELPTFSSSNYDTSNALVKSYATFQYSSDGANKPISNFTNTVAMPQSGEVTPLSSWTTDRYEIVNNAIIYPPTSISGTVTDLSIVLSLDFYVNGANANPIKINSLQLASISLNKTLTSATPTPINGIGTKFGKSIYPYSISSGVMKYDQKNSIAIAKNSNEYLYLNKFNGIRLSGNTSSGDERGLKIPINEYNLSNFLISSMQMSVLWTERSFSTTPQKILTIVGETTTYNLYVVSINTSNTRGKIFVSSDGTLANEDKASINFYWNSILTKNPIISIDEWGMLGLAFSGKMSMSQQNAYIGLLSTMLFTNISYYLIDVDKFGQQVITNSWNQIASTYTNWTNVAAKNWSQINFSSGTTSPSINPSITYRSILGINTTIIDSDPYTGKLLTQKYSYVSYPNFTTQSIMSQPV